MTRIDRFYCSSLPIVVIVFSAWLDLFPQRMSRLKLRTGCSPGMPLGCVLAPMVVAGVCGCAIGHSAISKDLLIYYMVSSSCIGLCPLLGSLVHWVPYPTSIVVYCSTLTVLIFVLEVFLEIPILFWSLITCLLYSGIVSWMLDFFPETFTMGEAFTIGQGVTFLIVDTVAQMLHKAGIVEISKQLAFKRHETTLYLEMMVLGIILCCGCLAPILKKAAFARGPVESRFWSATFFLTTGMVTVMVLLPSLQVLLENRPVLWLVSFILSSKYRVLLVGYWFIWTVVAIVYVVVQSRGSNSVFGVLQSSDPSSVVSRKWFHLMMICIFVPGIILDPVILQLAASSALCLLILLEVIRFFSLWPIGDAVHKVLIEFVDSKDSGRLILSHIYLLAGFSLPLWLYPLRVYTNAPKISLYAGVISLGFGDSLAAIVGSTWGKFKWPGTQKTMEGSVAAVVGQLVAVVLIYLIDPQIRMLAHHWPVIVGVVSVTALLEAYTEQNDNLILGLFQFALLVTFC
ncbi:dolichol kinase-like isoform X2 [Dysidea avara]|uniref:dolichol kinase-like isoform X2 n=1 Tax=Dysidea avara TaxID=196820 RepID=UPI00331CCDD9